MRAKNVLRNMFYIEKDSRKIVRLVSTLVIFKIHGRSFMKNMILIS